MLCHFHGVDFLGAFIDIIAGLIIFLTMLVEFFVVRDIIGIDRLYI